MSVQKISIVIPIFNEAKSIEILYQQIITRFKVSLKNYSPEIILINDGSEDETINVLNKLQLKDKKIKVINFKKNLGKTQALKLGFEKSTASIIATLDSDLQDDPNNIPKLLEKLDKGFDLVVGWRKYRKDPPLKIFVSKFFNFLLKSITQITIHDFNCGLKVMTKEVAKNLEFFGQSHRFIPLIAAKKGFKVGEVIITHRPRLYGKSKYDWTKFFISFFDLLKIQTGR